MGYDSVLVLMCGSSMSLLVAKDPTTKHVAIDMPFIAWHRVSSTGSVEFPTELPDRILSHALAIANGSFTIVSTFTILIRRGILISYVVEAVKVSIRKLAYWQADTISTTLSWANME